MFSLEILLHILFVIHFQDNFYRMNECHIHVVLEIRPLEETLIL